MRIVLAVIYLLGIALSIKSVIVIGRAAPWTSAGWWLTAAYFVAAGAKATVTPTLPVGVEYAILVALAATFVVAGVRDEAQAEPWWWPHRLGATRAERRVGGA
jgi:hypothetical protein